MNPIPTTEYLQNQLQIGKWDKLQGFDLQFLDKTIAVFGVGGSGCPMALTLTRMGFRRIVLVDKDVVEPKNLTRQVLFGKQDTGKAKTQAAFESLMNHHTIQSEFEVFQMDINAETAQVEHIIRRSDFVFNLVDNDLALYTVSKTARAFRKPAIYFGTGSAAGMTSQLMYQDAEQGACIPCMHGLPPDEQELRRREAHSQPHGITPSWYPTPALGAAFSAVLMVKSLLKQPVTHNYILSSLYALEFEKLNMQADPNCSICGGKIGTEP